MRLKHPVLVFLPCLCLGLAAGCSKNPSAPAQVSGTVTYKGSPVTGGNLTFYTENAGTYSVALDENGKYTGYDFPAADAIVTVETESLNPAKKQVEYKGQVTGGPKYGRPPGGPVKAKGMPLSPPPEGAVTTNVKYVRIPAKYADKASSPLRVTLSAGGQTHDFELTD
jgi:hypothetical protein